MCVCVCAAATTLPRAGRPTGLVRRLDLPTGYACPDGDAGEPALRARPAVSVACMPYVCAYVNRFGRMQALRLRHAPLSLTIQPVIGTTVPLSGPRHRGLVYSRSIHQAPHTTYYAHLEARTRTRPHTAHTRHTSTAASDTPLFLTTRVRHPPGARPIAVRNYCTLP